MVYFGAHLTLHFHLSIYAFSRLLHLSFFVNFCLKLLLQYSLVPLEHVIFLLFASEGNYYPGHRALLPRVSAEVFPCRRDGYGGQGLGWNARQTLVLQVELQDIHYSFIQLQPNPLQHSGFHSLRYRVNEVKWSHWNQNLGIINEDPGQKDHYEQTQGGRGLRRGL